VADLARVVTADNVEELSSDLNSFLLHVLLLKLGMEVAGQEFEPEKLGVGTLHWTPDGKRECQTTIHEPGQSESEPYLTIRTKPGK